MGCGCEKKKTPSQKILQETALTGDIKYDGGDITCGENCPDDCESFFEITNCDNLNEVIQKMFDLVCNRAPKNYHIVQSADYVFTAAGDQVINTTFNLVLDPGCYVVDFSTSAHPGNSGDLQSPILTSKWFDFRIVSNSDVTKTDIDAGDINLAGSNRRFRNQAEAVADDTIQSIPIYTKGQTLVVPEGEQRIVKVVIDCQELGWGIFNDRILSALKIA